MADEVWPACRGGLSACIHSAVDFSEYVETGGELGPRGARRGLIAAIGACVSDLLIADFVLVSVHSAVALRALA